MLKVLQINTVTGIGSTGRIVADIDEVLQSCNFDSYIAYGRGVGDDSEKSIRIGTKMDNYSHVIKTRLLDQHGFGSKKATLDFIRKVKKINPDVIHLHNIHGYFLNVEMFFDFLKEAKKPVVWTLHDCWPFTGHCAYFDYSGCECWRVDGDNNCIQKRTYPSSLFINNSKKNYSRKKSAFTEIDNLTIVTPSHWLAKIVKESFLSEYPCEVINNGIDLSTFKPTKSSFRIRHNIEKKFVILGVASVWEERKGLKYFIDLSDNLIEDEVIILVGLKEEKIKSLPKNIIGISRTDSVKELAEIYSTSDVFLNPTLEDNFPTTNLESLACGTPVVTFKTGGSGESVDINCGHVVEKGNLHDLKRALNEVKEKGKMSYSKNCTQRAESLYSKTDRFHDYVNLYKKVLRMDI